MVFSSLVFLYAYLPAVLLTVFFVPKRWKNLVLLVFSLLFYGWGEPVYILLMIASFSMAYGFGFLVAKNRETNPTRAKRWMFFSLTVTLSFLFFFKYYNFFAVNLSRLPFLSIPVIPGLRLPIGISFYTFQIMSYTVDLWRGDAALQKNYISFGTYVTLFPQLIAGPIVRYREVDGQLRERHTEITDFSDGVARFCCGLSKKVLLGDPLASGYAYFRDSLLIAPDTLGAWLSLICYTLHLYFDFSGYSDMAIGLGRMFGFRFPENFNYPYLAKSITEFWRRWHITLSAWFREYVYIPLGGNRRGKWIQLRNLAVVWLLTGFWHGANWNYLLWGGWFLILLVAEHFLLGKYLSRLPGIIQHFYAMFFVTVGFLIFSQNNLDRIGMTFRCLFSFGCPFFTVESLYQLRVFLPLLILAGVGCTPFANRMRMKLIERFPKTVWLRPALCVVALLLSTAYLTDASFSPFEYLNF